MSDVTDLWTIVNAEIDRLERLSTSEIEPGLRALRVAIEPHERHRFGWCVACSDSRGDGIEPYPCEQLRDIAAALGIEGAT
jgi:hypothetical protein